MDKNRLLMAVPSVWWKSSASAGGNGDCVETATLSEGAELIGMGVRDSKNRTGGVLRFSKEAWQSFVGFAVKNGPDLP